MTRRAPRRLIALLLVALLVPPISPATAQTPPSLSISDVTVTEGGLAQFTITLSAASSQQVRVVADTQSDTAVAGIPCQSGVDVNTQLGNLVFNPGTTSRTFSVTTCQDTLDEDNETFFVNLTNPLNATIADNQARVTIRDDEPALRISDPQAVEGAVMEFLVTLSPPANQVVTVRFSTVGGSTATPGQDYAPQQNGTLTFQPGVPVQVIRVQTVPDQAPEPTETFLVSLSNATNARIAKSPGLGRIINRPVP